MSLPLLSSLFAHACESELDLCLALISETCQKWWYVISEATPREALQLPLLPSWNFTLRTHSLLEDEKPPGRETRCPAHGQHQLPFTWARLSLPARLTLQQDALLEPLNPGETNQEQPTPPAELWAIINHFTSLSFRVVCYGERLSPLARYFHFYRAQIIPSARQVPCLFYTIAGIPIPCLL